jgi:hypothetical protein
VMLTLSPAVRYPLPPTNSQWVDSMRYATRCSYPRDKRWDSRRSQTLLDIPKRSRLSSALEALHAEEDSKSSE